MILTILIAAISVLVPICRVLPTDAKDITDPNSWTYDQQTLETNEAASIRIANLSCQELSAFGDAIDNMLGMAAKEKNIPKLAAVRAQELAIEAESVGGLFKGPVGFFRKTLAGLDLIKVEPPENVVTLSIESEAAILAIGEVAGQWLKGFGPVGELGAAIVQLLTPLAKWGGKELATKGALQDMGYFKVTKPGVGSMDVVYDKQEKQACVIADLEDLDEEWKDKYGWEDEHIYMYLPFDEEPPKLVKPIDLDKWFIYKSESVPSMVTMPDKVSPDDIEWLAKLIASEAGSVYDKGNWVRCTDQERTAVGWTALNRLEADTFGGTLEEVITAPGQYAYEQNPTAEIEELAKKLMEGQIPDPTGGATHFFSPISMPKEGESTRGFDVGGGLRNVPGIAEKVYFPSWAETYTWTGDLNNVRRAYFMFYRNGAPVTPVPEPEISARITGYSANPAEVEIGESTNLEVNIVNTSDISWTFGVGATLRKPDGTIIHLPIQAVSLSPGKEDSAQWTRAIDMDMEGNWDIRFSVWEQSTPPATNIVGDTDWLVGLVEGIRPSPMAMETYINEEMGFSISKPIGWRQYGPDDMPEGASVGWFEHDRIGPGIVVSRPEVQITLEDDSKVPLLFLGEALEVGHKDMDFLWARRGQYVIIVGYPENELGEYSRVFNYCLNSFEVLSQASPPPLPQETTFEVTGTMHYLDFEGGFWGIQGDDSENYDPTNLPEELKKEGLRAHFRLKISEEQWSVHMWGKLVEVVNYEIIEEDETSVLPSASGKIVFMERMPHEGKLWAVDPETGEKTLLHPAFTVPAGYCWELMELSPDGKKRAELFHKIWIESLGGKEETKISIPECEKLISDSPHWAPDGKRFAFCLWHSNGIIYIYIVNTDGSGLVRLTEGCFPSWSPDGKRLVFCHSITDSNLSIIKSDGTNRQKLGIKGSMPAWSPDGKKIAYIGLIKDHDHAMDLYVLNLETYKVENITAGLKSWNKLPMRLIWSPDGTKLAFEACTIKTREPVVSINLDHTLFIIDADGGGLTRLTPVGYHLLAWFPK